MRNWRDPETLILLQQTSEARRAARVIESPTRPPRFAALLVREVKLRREPDRSHAEKLDHLEVLADLVRGPVPRDPVRERESAALGRQAGSNRHAGESREDGAAE